MPTVSRGLSIRLPVPTGRGQWDITCLLAPTGFRLPAQFLILLRLKKNLPRWFSPDSSSRLIWASVGPTMPKFYKGRCGLGREMGGLTSWNARSGDSGLGGRVWTACCTASSRAGGCGWGWSAGSCLPLPLQRSSPCWGSACGYCKAEEATLVTARQSCTFSRVADYVWPWAFNLGVGKLARDSPGSG